MIEFEVKSKKQYISVNIRDSPRHIPYAGNEADGVTIGYKAKYNQQLQSIKDNYKAFDEPYNGKDNDDFVNGQVCLKDIDPDHLGSSSYITNLDGEVSKHIEYVPFREVFIEERNNAWNTPYLFNAKELDEETGMYCYGARYYELRLSLWMSTDPMQEKYPNITSYCYTFDNPIKYIDPQGLENVVVVGNQGNSPKSDRTCILRIDKRHFLEAGLNEAIKLKSQPFNLNEPTTMIVYHGNYSNEELKYYESRAKKEGIRFLIANNADEIINYINNGDMRNFISSGKRISEKEKKQISLILGMGGQEPYLLDTMQ